MCRRRMSLIFTRRGCAEWVEEPESPEGLRDSGLVRVQALYSMVSAGTELSMFRGMGTDFRSGFDYSTRVFTSGDGEWRYPIRPGYQMVGQLSGTREDPERRLVFLHHPHDTHPHADKAQLIQLPQGTDPLHASSLALVKVALNAVLTAGVRIGESALVTGAGAIGLLTTQLLMASGAKSVYVCDSSDCRLELASQYGATAVPLAAKTGCSDAVRRLTGGSGVDAAVECSGSLSALQDAIRSTRCGCSVVCVGRYAQTGPVDLGSEFHMNNITLRPAQVAGIPPELSHRWTEERRHSFCVDLLKTLDFDGFFEVFPWSDAPEVYRRLAEGSLRRPGIAFSY